MIENTHHAISSSGVGVILVKRNFYLTRLNMYSYTLIKFRNHLIYTQLLIHLLDQHFIAHLNILEYKTILLVSSFSFKIYNQTSLSVVSVHKRYWIKSYIPAS